MLTPQHAQKGIETSQPIENDAKVDIESKKD